MVSKATTKAPAKVTTKEVTTVRVSAPAKASESPPKIKVDPVVLAEAQKLCGPFQRIVIEDTHSVLVTNWA
jgi:hypothetical protein